MSPIILNELTREPSDLEAAVSALREEFVRKFRAERQANASTAHEQIQKSVPGLVVYYAQEAMKSGMSKELIRACCIT